MTSESRDIVRRLDFALLKKWAHKELGEQGVALYQDALAEIVELRQDLDRKDQACRAMAREIERMEDGLQVG